MSLTRDHWLEGEDFWGDSPAEDCSGLAESERRPAVNREIRGSSPRPRASGCVAQSGERAVVSREVAGSKPVTPAIFYRLHYRGWPDGEGMGF